MQTPAVNSSTAAEGSNSVPAQPRLVHAAHEFEAQMMKELLKPMTDGETLTGDDENRSGSNGALGQFASESLGRALSEHGGLGIAHQILGELSPIGNRTRQTG